MSGLIWIQTVWHSDGISERFKKKDKRNWKKSTQKNSRWPKGMQNYPGGQRGHTKTKSQFWCNYVPKMSRVGDTLFLVRIPSASTLALASRWLPLFRFLSLSSEPVDGFWPNLHGWGKKLIRFWWPWPYFPGHRGTLICPKYGFHALLFEPMDGFWPNCIDT